MQSQAFKEHVSNSIDPSATIQANCHHRVTFKCDNQSDVMHQVNASLVRSALGVGGGDPLPVKASPMAAKRNPK